jgi:hypothetical protein
MNTTPSAAASGSSYVLAHAAEVNALLTLPPLNTAWTRVQK